ncbi:MAK10-like protein [Tanacetum coccineum]
MGDENSIRTLGDYSRPSHEGYRNTIELHDGNNVVPLRSDTIRLVQNGCSFNRLWSEDPNQHLKDFLKLVDSLDPNCEIDRAIGGKFRDKNAEESWEIIENLAFYDHEGWDDPRYIAKLVKAISLPQDTSRTPDRRLFELEDQISYLLKGSRTTHETRSTHIPQVYAKRHRTQQAGCSRAFESGDRKEEMKDGMDDELARSTKEELIRWEMKVEVVVETPRSRHIASNLLERLPAGSISTWEDLSTRFLAQLFPPGRTSKLRNEILMFQQHQVIAHASMYNSILDKYVESLELGKDGSVFIQGEMPKRMKDPGLFTLPCRLGNSKPFDTLADLGSCVNLIPLYLFKMLKIRLLEETDQVFGLADGTKSYPVGIVKNVEVHIGRLKLLEDLYVIDMKKDPATPLLIGRGFLATASAVINCKKAKIATGE